MLDDSISFARRLRALGQPVTLRVVQDLPHGFLSLAFLTRETRQASALCTELIHNILHPPEDAPPPPPTTAPSLSRHRKLERTCHAAYAATQESSSQTGQKGQSGILGGTGGPAGPTLKGAPGTPEHPAGGSSTAGQPSGARPASDPDVTDGQDAGSSGCTVGRGVGA
uniref:Uncharacterized protein n=2 Tax=Sphaerodactylus townsendi TaxID=933632 RepID=A0ACB8FTH4_9SAUR